MTAPSSGNAIYRGMSINEDMNELRQSLGICFQHDVLFPDLSVEEHLLLFGQIKGYANDELMAVAEKQIREVGFDRKAQLETQRSIRWYEAQAVGGRVASWRWCSWTNPPPAWTRTAVAARGRSCSTTATTASWC
ncbi:unnamed protein product [Phytophthora lilii]|uniref:Unnamed protein product n=1 Tax=Phytophthora lilii TaxID=2077276 RepID=A0A9W6THC6_9STRA|nr:unnamed protein product [Phytophthora lilii]